MIFAVIRSHPLPRKGITYLPTAMYPAMSPVLRTIRPCPVGFGLGLYSSGLNGRFLWIWRL